MTVPADLEEPPFTNKQMISMLYDQIISEQRRDSDLRSKMAIAVNASNVKLAGSVNRQWTRCQFRLRLLYELWNLFTNEEFKP